ncbi:MAG: glycogen-binding domain-containing protein [Treponema sp.]|jgi:hypothetical protein|nr:glycogen-binding domain-containing protein [Treponema sp.]
MKTITTSALLFLIIGSLGAVDIESYQFIDHLLSLPGPGAPIVYEDAVIFTASSGVRRVGVAFAYEGFSRVYWLRKLLIPQDPLTAEIPPGAKVPDPYRDSGLLFYVHQLPESVRDAKAENPPVLEYRVIIDGLWTTDPANTLARRDTVSGLLYSYVPIPALDKIPIILRGPSGSLNFSFKGPPGEVVTVAGSFNGWDPFMYELAEGPAGVYSLILPLPPGTYQYIFFHRGERYLDPYNFRRVYTREGKAASEIIVE